ncbi:hypothetical protein BU17DRAFT_50326 [Hysterangium stoloniferum]|nr:hypothetical protein BU17DRAFT_50326 [Hysterangium stoloniferum]
MSPNTTIPQALVNGARRAGATSSCLPYRVIRNSRGSLPVYSDIRNAGTRYQVQIRNVVGDANILLRDLRTTLYPPQSPEAAVPRGHVVRSRHIVLQGRGSGWKNQVSEWLIARGF